jgi:hypothetical protein
LYADGGSEEVYADGGTEEEADRCFGAWTLDLGLARACWIDEDVETCFGAGRIDDRWLGGTDVGVDGKSLMRILDATLHLFESTFPSSWCSIAS